MNENKPIGSPFTHYLSRLKEIKRESVKFVLNLLCLACTVFVTACSASDQTVQAAPQSQPTAVVLPVVTPAAIAAKLAPTATLAEAAKGLAAALGVAPDNVRVRIKADCSVCEAEKLQKATSLNGVSVAEAMTLLPANYDFWLFVKNFTCAYHFDGKIYKPKSCQLAPL
jgi:hypothetical protein